MIKATRTVVTAAFLFACGTAAAQQLDVKRAGMVNGQSISAEDVESAAAADLEKLEQRRAQFENEMKREKQTALETALESILRDRVLAAEAAKRNISVNDLLEIEVNSAVSAPTDEAVVQFYNANKQQLEGSLGDNVAAIRAYLRDQKREPVFDAFIDGLKKTYGAVSFVEPLRVPVPTEGRPFRGRADAPVTIVEFSDFECPFCRAASPTLQQLSADYEDKVRLVYVQFPLADLHPHALKAAEASLCAMEQGKFWEMHDAMFADQANLTVDDLKKHAAALSLDGDAFGACLDSGRQFARVREDVGEGVKAGVSGTPALFINGRMLVGAQPYREIQRIVEDELRRNASN